MKFDWVIDRCDTFLKANPTGVIVVLGPTASGKTSLSILIAKHLKNAEIINADSRQIYSGLPILTAVPTEEERQGVPHHLFESISPENPINVSQWKEMAEEKISEIQKRKNVAIICGGTGLWVNSLTKNFSLGVEPDEAFREKMQKKSNEELWELLKQTDPEACKALHKNNKKYVIRALEICKAKGNKSENAKEGTPSYSFLMIGITYPREQLYARIHARNEIMLKNSVVDEVREFLHQHPDMPKMDSVFISHGVPEISAYLKGVISLDEAKEKMMKITRNYAKRQLTWWRRDNRVVWISGETGEKVDIQEKQW